MSDKHTEDNKISEKKPDTFIEFKDVYKRFGNTVANNNLSFKINKGSIHGIIGENGAGKSTAMKILFGLYQKDSGQIFINNKEVLFKNPIEAMKNGIGMVHQHFMLAEPLTALDNLILHDQTLSGLEILNRKILLEKYSIISKKYNFSISWNEKVENLPVGIQQQIEILKILSQNSNLIILDEPTAVLTPQEIKELFKNLKLLKEQGKTILIITHKLKEVMQITDHVTVFRSGQVAGERKTSETNIKELAELMVGHHLPTSEKKPPQFANAKDVLKITNLTIKDNKFAHSPLIDINLNVPEGKIIGIAGVEGNGQSTLIENILNPKLFFENRSGSIFLNNQDVSNYNASEIRKLNIGAFPEDRLKFGVLKECSLSENFLLGHQRKKIFQDKIKIAFKNLLQLTQKAVDTFDVRPNNISLRIQDLSGGNQQKFVVARELWFKPNFILASQPTRGVDIGAIEFIHNQLIHASQNGSGILLISSELDELMKLSDEIYVLFKGQLLKKFNREQFDEIQIGLAMGGLA